MKYNHKNKYVGMNVRKDFICHGNMIAYDRFPGGGGKGKVFGKTGKWLRMERIR